MLSKIKLYILLELFTALVIGSWQYFQRGLDAAIMISLTILIAFSPFCLALTTPIVFKFARKFVDELGVKMELAESLIKLSYVDTVAITLKKVITDGNFYITDLIPEGLSQNSLLSYAASVSSESNHFLAKKICETAEHRNLILQTVAAFREVPGCGVEALMNGRVVRLGRPKWITSEKVEVSSELLTKVDQLAARGKTPLFLLIGKMVRGLIALKDEIDLDAKDFLEALKRRNFETALLSSESKKTVNFIAKNISFDNVRFALSPDLKAREIQLLKTHGKNVAMIGKDVSDLPALLTADTSILMKDDNFNLVDETIHIDFEIDQLRKFFSLMKISNRVNELITLNKKIAYLAWFLMIPPSLMLALESPPIPFNPFFAAIGVIIFAILIVANSFRMRNFSL